MAILSKQILSQIRRPPTNFPATYCCKTNFLNTWSDYVSHTLLRVIRSMNTLLLHACNGHKDTSSGGLREPNPLLEFKTRAPVQSSAVPYVKDHLTQNQYFTESHQQRNKTMVQRGKNKSRKNN